MPTLIEYDNGVYSAKKEPYVFCEYTAKTADLCFQDYTRHVPFAPGEPSLSHPAAMGLSATPCIMDEVPGVMFKVSTGLLSYCSYTQSFTSCQVSIKQRDTEADLAKAEPAVAAAMAALDTLNKKV